MGGPPRALDTQRVAFTVAAQQAAFARRRGFDPRQPRDGDGQWSDGPGGSKADLSKSNIDMTPDERQFLSDYVEDGQSFQEINSALRGQTPVTPGMAEKIDKLDALTARAQLDGDATLYRAMSIKVTDPLMSMLMGGGEWTDPGYGSVSGDRDAVEDFQGVGSNAVVFEIRAKKGQPVLVLGDDLSDTAMMQTSQEALLPRGYTLRFGGASGKRVDGVMVWTAKATYEAPKSQPAITAAFNPGQRRGPDGKWARMGGGRADDSRPDSRRVKLPPQPPIKVAPRAAIFAEGWMRRDDPAERAAGFWQGRFGDQRVIRDVFRSIGAGREPLDGIDLDRGFNMTYLRVAPDSEDEGRVYDKTDLANELTSAGRWLHEALANAAPSTAPLYRGMRMKRADVPKVGDTWDSDVLSWAEDRGWAEVYAGMEQDADLGRVGEMEVVLRLSGPKRSVDLGPELLDEHLTQGRYRVTRVSGTGRKRFVTVEEVPG